MNKRAIFISLLLFLSIRILAALPVKGMWVVRYALNDRQETQRVLQMAERLKLTDLYVQVWAKGCFLMRYNDPSMLQNDSDRINKNLKELIRAAHKKDIRIHAWLNALNIWSGSKVPASRQHLFYTDQKALLRAADCDSLPPYKKIHGRGVDGYFIEPLNGRNISLLKKIIARLIVDYGVDGIHLDYFRLPGEQMLFSPQGRSSYILEHYFDPVIFFQPQSASLFSAVQKNYIKGRYLNYQRHNMRRLLKILSKHIKKINQHTLLSIAVKANIYRARSFYLQDWSSWLNENLCDYVVLMNYVPDTEQFLSNLKAAVRESTAAKIVVGVSTYNQPLPQVAQKINYIRGMPFEGYALFSFNDLQKKNENMVQRALVRK